MKLLKEGFTMFTTRCGEKFDDFFMILDDGDLDMTKICNCENASTVNNCEKNCPYYCQCANVALADDIFVAYEEY